MKFKIHNIIILLCIIPILIDLHFNVENPRKRDQHFISVLLLIYKCDTINFHEPPARIHIATQLHIYIQNRAENQFYVFSPTFLHFPLIISLLISKTSIYIYNILIYRVKYWCSTHYLLRVKIKVDAPYSNYFS